MNRCGFFGRVRNLATEPEAHFFVPDLVHDLLLRRNGRHEVPRRVGIRTHPKLLLLVQSSRKLEGTSGREANPGSLMISVYFLSQAVP